MLFATIVAWFGIGSRARLFSWYLLLWILAGPAPAFLSPWPWLNETAFLINAPVTALAACLLATISSTFGHPIGPLRRTLEWSTYTVASIGVGVMTVVYELILITPWFHRFWPLVNFLWVYQLGWIIALLLGAACALAALATVSAEERQRAAWLLIPLVALNVVSAIWAFASAFAGGQYSGAQQALEIVGGLAGLVVVGVMTYAVLSRRLLDVQFVINRAAVFAGVSLVVVGIFVLVEFLFNKFFAVASRTTSIAVVVGIALAVGVSLQYIHHYVDKFVDRVFFRARHEHEQSLRAFAHEAAFITDSDTLLDNTVHEVAVHAESDPVSILLRDERGSYRTARSSSGAIDAVSENDRGILKLRAWHAPVDLDDVDTTLQGSRAYPLMSRGDLLGVLVCGRKRDGQAYAPDESEALTLLARSVGSALDGLRRDNSKIGIDDLRIGITEIIRDALRDLTRSADGGLSISTLQPPTGHEAAGQPGGIARSG
jgi:hypothetical protein